MAMRLITEARVERKYTNGKFKLEKYGENDEKKICKYFKSARKTSREGNVEQHHTQYSRRVEHSFPYIQHSRKHFENSRKKGSTYWLSVFHFILFLHEDLQQIFSLDAFSKSSKNDEFSFFIHSVEFSSEGDGSFQLYLDTYI